MTNSRTRPLGLAVPLRGDPRTAVDRFGRDPGAWLPVPARPTGPSRWRVQLDTGQAYTTGTAVVGRLSRSGDRWSRSLNWTGDGRDTLLPAARMVPAFRGSLTVTTGDAEADLGLLGAYAPPLRMAGSGAHSVALHRIATAIAAAFLEAVAAALTPPDPSGPAGPPPRLGRSRAIRG